MYSGVPDSPPFCTQTANPETNPWWYVDLEDIYDVKEVWITNKDQVGMWLCYFISWFS